MAVVLLLLNTASVDHNRVHIADAVVLLLLLNLDVAGSSSTGCFLPRWLHHGERWTLERLANKNHQKMFTSSASSSLCCRKLCSLIFGHGTTRRVGRKIPSMCFVFRARPSSPSQTSSLFFPTAATTTTHNSKLQTSSRTLHFGFRAARSLVPFQ